METDTLKGIAALSTQVAAQATDQAEAFASQNAAEAELLAAVIELVRPALRAITSRLPSRKWTTGLADVNRQRTGVEYHDQPGLHLEGNHKAIADAPNDNSGTYEGCGLYLLADGTLAERTFTGNWSRWQGASEEMISTLEPISIEAAMTAWSVEPCIKSIHAALEEQLAGKGPTRAKAARARAEQLRALVALLKA